MSFCVDVVVKCLAIAVGFLYVMGFIATFLYFVSDFRVELYEFLILVAILGIPSCVAVTIYYVGIFVDIIRSCFKRTHGDNSVNV